MIGAWSLPGPDAAVGRILTELFRERVQVLHSPRDLAGLRSALEARILKAARSSIVIQNEAAGGFRAALCDQVGAQGTIPIAALANTAALQGAVIVLSAEGALDTDVCAFARIARRLPDEQGPCLTIVSRDGLARLDDVATQEVRNVVGPLDGAAYAAWLPRFEPPLVGQLVASVAIEVAAWDLTLLDRLTALPAPQACRPDQHLSAWVDGPVQAWIGMALRWDLGCLDGWGGVDVAHPIWLAANAPSKLEKRVWRGQMATLLPWIEDHRLLLIERYDKLLRAATGRQGDIVLLDWGPLVLEIRARDERQCKAAESFRIARNELAHGRPLRWPLIQACIQASPRLMGTAAL